MAMAGYDRGMLSRLLILLAGSLLVVGAEVPSEPDGFWPLPAPTWMDDPNLTSVVTLREVMADRPAAAAKLEVGDLVSAVGAVRIVSKQEFMLAKDLAVARGDGVDRVDHQPLLEGPKVYNPRCCPKKCTKCEIL